MESGWYLQTSLAFRSREETEPLGIMPGREVPFPEPHALEDISLILMTGQGVRKSRAHTCPEPAFPILKQPPGTGKPWIPCWTGLSPLPGFTWSSPPGPSSWPQVMLLVCAEPLGVRWGGRSGCNLDPTGTAHVHTRWARGKPCSGSVGKSQPGLKVRIRPWGGRHTGPEGLWHCSLPDSAPDTSECSLIYSSPRPSDEVRAWTPGLYGLSPSAAWFFSWLLPLVN